MCVCIILIIKTAAVHDCLSEIKIQASNAHEYHFFSVRYVRLDILPCKQAGAYHCFWVMFNVLLRQVWATDHVVDAAPAGLLVGPRGVLTHFPNFLFPRLTYYITRLKMNISRPSRRHRISIRSLLLPWKNKTCTDVQNFWAWKIRVQRWHVRIIMIL